MAKGPNDTYKLRAPCRYCGCTKGYWEPRGGQNCIFCAECKRLAYNAPRAEMSQKPRSATTSRAGVKPRQRARLLERATGRCELCGQSKGILHIGHILSVEDGVSQGLMPSQINDDENLMVMCEECNLGFGSLSLSPRLYTALLRRRALGG